MVFSPVQHLRHRHLWFPQSWCQLPSSLAQPHSSALSITEYLELDGLHKDHSIHLPLHRTTSKITLHGWNCLQYWPSLWVSSVLNFALLNFMKDVKLREMEVPVPLHTAWSKIGTLQIQALSWWFCSSFSCSFEKKPEYSLMRFSFIDHIEIGNTLSHLQKIIKEAFPRVSSSSTHSVSVLQEPFRPYMSKLSASWISFKKSSHK